jgi:hypothetical protein
MMAVLRSESQKKAHSSLRPSAGGVAAGGSEPPGERAYGVWKAPSLIDASTGFRVKRSSFAPDA